MFLVEVNSNWYEEFGQHTRSSRNSKISKAKNFSNFDPIIRDILGFQDAWIHQKSNYVRHYDTNIYIPLGLEIVEETETEVRHIRLLQRM